MVMIEITEKKYEKLSDHIEESLRHLGKAMSCIAEIGEPYGLGYRDEESMRSHEGHSYRKDYGSRYGMRSRYDNYGDRYMGYKDDEDEWDDEDMMGERRRRSRRTGRYV